VKRGALMALVGLALGQGCGVRGREDLVGRYEADVEGRPEAWTLAGDGTCQIVRQPDSAKTETRRCEWEYVEREGRSTLVVTVLAHDGADAATSHQTRYVLTPSRFGQTVTIPLGSRWQLRKVP
jgi:hypothetical protein